jgi:hypothetical protein
LQTTERWVEELNPQPGGSDSPPRGDCQVV